MRRSEKKADVAQPENFKDAETAEKLVEIGPDLDKAPIKGIAGSIIGRRPTDWDKFPKHTAFAGTQAEA
ncbi:MAG: hypothetical protein ABI887_05265 [Burkholderiales bacterium]